MMGLTAQKNQQAERTPAKNGDGGDQPMAEKQVRIKTLSFGEITVDPKLILSMPKGILGFESVHRYVIIETPDSEPFKWFQSLDDPALAFVIVNPLVFFLDYRIDVDRRELDELKITDPSSVVTHVIVSVPDGDMTRMSANLQGPIVINTENNLAKQLVLTNGPYQTCHPLMEQLEKMAAKSLPDAGSRTPST
jgi:flagellar assembly factor FliW